MLLLQIMVRSFLIFALVPLAGCTNILHENAIANCRVSSNCTVVETRPAYGPPHQAAIEPGGQRQPKPTPPR
jgi:hypothetical protein